MFPARYFPRRYFAPRYWAKVGATPAPGSANPIRVTAITGLFYLVTVGTINPHRISVRTDAN